MSRISCKRINDDVGFGGAGRMLEAARGVVMMELVKHRKSFCDVNAIRYAVFGGSFFYYTSSP